jgi:hypothetical protein
VSQEDIHFRWATTLRPAGQNPMQVLQVLVPFCSISYSQLENKSHGIENILVLGVPGFEPCPAILYLSHILIFKVSLKNPFTLLKC